MDGTDYISGVEKKLNSGIFTTCSSVHTSKHKHMQSDVLSGPRYEVTLYGKEDNLGNIKVTSGFMLSLKKTGTNVEHSGVLLDFIRSTMAPVITSKSSKQPLITLQEPASLMETRSLLAST